MDAVAGTLGDSGELAETKAPAPRCDPLSHEVARCMRHSASWDAILLAGLSPPVKQHVPVGMTLVKPSVW
eukprot:scaffold3120_cov26-Tisochrysis_lutea.AAC.6